MIRLRLPARSVDRLLARARRTGLPRPPDRTPAPAEATARLEDANRAVRAEDFDDGSIGFRIRSPRE